MTASDLSYAGYRFPPAIIGHAVWLSHRFCLSLRDVEDLLAQRGITVSYETIRQWCHTWYLDELFVKIQGRRRYLWRAVDQDRDVINILVQSRRNRQAATRFLRRLLKGQGRAPCVSHQPTRQREGQMRRFKSAGHAQHFLSVHGPVQNLFRVGRHVLRSAHYRLFRTRAFGEWDAVTCAC